MASPELVAGLVVRLEANRPTVHLADREEEWLCHLRGRIRRTHGRILVGDRVLVRPTGPGEGAIEAVLDRAITLVRPPLANVTGLLVVFSRRHPVGSEELLDRRLVLAELTGLAARIVASKADLVSAAERASLNPWARWYPVVWTSTRTGEGIPEVRDAVAGGIWVLTGESGAGKSSLVRALVPGAEVQVSDLSRIERGRQTTRTVALYRVGTGYVADTPGFTQLDLPPVTPTALRDAFPELRAVSCRFPDCLHRGEPGCRVPERVARGEIHPTRYRHYLAFLAEVMALHRYD
jgi:ribosome biogenesis GTPase